MGKKSGIFVASPFPAPTPPESRAVLLTRLANAVGNHAGKRFKRMRDMEGRSLRTRPTEGIFAFIESLLDPRIYPTTGSNGALWDLLQISEDEAHFIACFCVTGRDEMTAWEASAALLKLASGRVIRKPDGSGYEIGPL